MLIVCVVVFSLTLEGMIEGKKIAGRPCNSYIGQITCSVRVKTFKELKKRRVTGQNRVVNQPLG